MLAKQKTVKTRSVSFRATRKHHSSEAAEDYTELIADLIRAKGEARTCEIAKLLGISHVTAVRTLQRLQREGYIDTSPHQPVSLTPKGERLARFARERHKTLVQFLIQLGVPRPVAEVDAEGAEHHISRTSLKYIRSFMKRWPKRE